MRAAVLVAAWASLAACCAQDVVASLGDASSSAGADATASADARADDDASTSANADASATPDGAFTPYDATTVGDAGSGLACHVDRFMACPDPREEMAGRTNETPIDGFYINSSSIGCSSGDQFAPGGWMLSSIICPREDADWYNTNFVPCDNITFIAEVRLHPLTPCEPDALRLEVQGRPCSDPAVRCTRDGDDQLIQYEVPPGNSVGSRYFGVVRVATDVKIDYELSYAIRR